MPVNGVVGVHADELLWNNIPVSLEETGHVPVGELARPNFKKAGRACILPEHSRPWPLHIQNLFDQRHFQKEFSADFSLEVWRDFTATIEASYWPLG